jgi:hypothetical protein
MASSVKPSHEELKHRILARKHELEAKLEHLKADSIEKSVDVAKCIQSDLDELGTKIEAGWEHLSEPVIKSLNEWMKHTDAHQ